VVNAGETISPMGESQQPSQPPLTGNHQHMNGLLRYGLAVISIIAGLLLHFALEAPFGPGLPTYITFYPFLMLSALVGGFGPGMVATLMTLLVVDIWVFPPLGQLTLKVPSSVQLVGYVLFAFIGLFISLVAELYRRSRTKAAAYDREQALRETRKEKEFLADLIQNAEQPFGVGFVDGSLIRFNRAFETLTGYNAQELSTIDWFKRLTPPEWWESEQRKLNELKTTRRSVRYEKEYIRKDGSRVPIELLTHIGRETESGREYYYAFITDLTERKKAEAEIRKANALLHQHASEVQVANNMLRESRLAALNLAEDADAARRQAEESSRNLLLEIGERKKTEEKLRTAADELAAANRELESFSYSVAHDLRNPLRTIDSLVDFLIEDCSTNLDGECKDYIARIKQGTRRMNSIIDDLLALSKISRQEMEIGNLNLSEMAHLTIQELSASQPERQVTVDIQSGMTVKADARLMSVTLANLLGNAWKYTSKVAHPSIQFGTFEKDGKQVYYVKDNGAGFDMKNADKLFEPFKRLHSDKEFTGTGVGLATVERAIKRHGGKVWAEGEVGKGATFYFTIL
jgi:PAS domain S-box-containing protein